MIIQIIENIGTKTIHFINALYEALSFFILCILSLFNLKNYHLKAFEIFILQFYILSISNIGFFIFLAFVFGSTIIGILISFAVGYNLQVQIGAIISNFVLNEFASFFTMFFVYYKMNSVQSTSQENSILAQLLGASMSTLILSILFAIIMFSSGLVINSFLMGMDLYTYKTLIFDAIKLHNFVILVSKSLVFGFVSASLVLYYYGKSRKPSIVWLVINIFFIETLFLMVQSLSI